MSNNKMSSIEWYIARSEELKFMNDLGQITNQEFDEQLEQAKQISKAMHKEEHHKTYNQGLMSNFQNFDDYYNETFGGNNEQQ